MDFKVILQPLALDDLEAMSGALHSGTATRGADYDHEQEHEND